MTAYRRLLVALMVSTLIHAGVVTVPTWQLPWLARSLHANNGQPLDAWLQRPGATTPSRAVTPRPGRTARPHAVASPDAVVVPNMPVAQAEPPPQPLPIPEAGPASAASDDAAVARPEQAAATGELLSLHVRIDYSVAMGEHGFVIGETVEELDNDGTTYRLRTTTGTTGLARLFKRVDVVYTSAGDIIDGHLRPRRFTAERDGKADVNALFDWQQGPAAVLGDRQYALLPGTQDMLSVFCELALQPILGNSVTLPVATGKDVEVYRFAVIGEEQLVTPMGAQPTLHLRTVGREPRVTEVWLGLNQARLPLRIRYVDRDGQVFDQLAGNIQVVPVMEERH